MMRVLVMASAIMIAGIAFVPQASAACDPGTQPDFCTSWTKEQVAKLEQRVRDHLGCIDPPPSCE